MVSSGEFDHAQTSVPSDILIPLGLGAFAGNHPEPLLDLPFSLLHFGIQTCSQVDAEAKPGEHGRQSILGLCRSLLGHS